MGSGGAMTGLDQVEFALAILSLAVTLVLAGRMVGEGLHRIYRAFFFYLIYEAARSAIVFAWRPNRTYYAIFYMVTEPVLWVLYFLIVRELFQLVLRNHPGIASASRKTLMWAMVAATAVAIVTMLPDLQPANQFAWIFNATFVVGRAIITTLLLFLLFITGLMAWVPMTLSRNSVYYCIGYAAFFLGKALAVLLRNLMSPELTKVFSVGNLVLANLCFAVWIWKLNQDGEKQTITVANVWRSEDAEHLVGQLDSINKMLAKGRRV